MGDQDGPLEMNSGGPGGLEHQGPWHGIWAFITPASRS